jgi:hypothetical protein
MLAAGQAPGIRAHQADALVESIGINIHAWPRSSYVSGDRWRSVILPALRELGVRHLRDGVGGPAEVAERHAGLVSEGFCLTLITDPLLTPALQLGPVLKRIGLRGIAMLEGVNEPDGAWVRKVGASPALAVAHQRDLHAIGSSLGIPVAASALINAGAARDYAGQAPYADYGNCHPYPGGRFPETPGWGANGYGSVEHGRDRLALAVAGSGKPFVATEAGYNNAVSAKAKAAAGHHGCSEAAAAAYEPRLFLHYLNLGVARSFHYELYDQRANPDDVEANFGWVRNDGSRKPSYVTMRNLISILSDPGPPFEPGRLAFTLAGATNGVMSCLLKKRDGTWFLALWLARSLWDIRTYSDVDLPEQTVSLTFGDSVRHVSGNHPSESTTFEEIPCSDRRVELVVSGRIYLLRVTT